MTGNPYKLGDGGSIDHRLQLPSAWTREIAGDVARLRIVPGDEQIELLKALLECVSEPMWLLYVLVVSRGEGETGRYQSTEPLVREQTLAFLVEFRAFFEQDGRHNLWMRSERGDAMLVYDRHGLIYAYGPLSEFQAVLARYGLLETDLSATTVPDPHSHHYHEQFDPEARELLDAMEWHHSPLREQDLS